jgi:hypothetical protein
MVETIRQPEVGFRSVEKNTLKLIIIVKAKISNQKP